MANVLVIYWNLTYPVRATIRDHLYSFGRYSRHRCFYLNMAVHGVPWYVRNTHWDLIIIHTILLSARWTPGLFVKSERKLRFLKDSDAVKAALPQDEFVRMNLICDLINRLDIDHVFSVAAESQWPVIYPTVDFRKVKFHKVLTGYIDDSLVRRISRIARSMPAKRPIHIGYRAYWPPAAFWWGRHGALKARIGDVFKEKALQRGLIVDISTRAEDTILGDDWFRFLLRCKYQIGVEGGASVFDWDGTYRERTEEYTSQHPEATFEEVEKACFANADGKIQYFAISPRHLECCLTRTCQVLVEGKYDGVLEPGKHYIEVKRDFSNLDQVLDMIAGDELREEITARAWRDIVGSGRYTYERFANGVIDDSLAGSTPRARSTRSAIWLWLLYHWMRLGDRLSWLTVALAFTSWKRLLPLIPIRLQRRVRGWILNETPGADRSSRDAGGAAR